jgi:hypothetical protein
MNFSLAGKERILLIKFYGWLEIETMASSFK